MDDRSGITVRRLAMALLLAALGFGGSAFATLLNRGADMVYDDVLNITWTRQAGDGVTRNWADSIAWAEDLVFAGFDDWRLPWGSVSAGTGPVATKYSCTGAGGADELACRDNELGYMYYYNLAGQGPSKMGTQIAVGGEILEILNDFYWTGTGWLQPNPPFIFIMCLPFNSGNTTNSCGPLSFGVSAWAVRAGDVPEPGSLALLGIGLAGLAFSRRCTRN